MLCQWKLGHLCVEFDNLTNLVIMAIFWRGNFCQWKLKLGPLVHLCFQLLNYYSYDAF